MAGLFVRLKLRLIRNGLRLGGMRTPSLVLGALFGALFAVSGFAALASPPRAAAFRAIVPVLAFCGAFVLWIAAPVFGFGLDETLDPGRFVLLPLTRRQLMSGLLAASATGIAPLATLLVLSGTIVGYGGSAAGRAIVAAAVVVEFALCLASARAVTSAISRLMTSRRGRDVWLVVGSFLFIGVQAAFQLLRVAGDRLASDVWLDVARVVRWTPPGLAARAIVDADAGRVGGAVIEVVAAACAVPLVVAWWARTLERTLTTVSTQAPAARLVTRRDDAGGGGLFPRVAPFLPLDRRGAVAAKDLRYFWRDPMQRAARIQGAIFAIGGVAAALLFRETRDPGITLGAAAFLWWLSLGSIAQFSFDRSAYWTNVVASGDPADDLLGKNIAFAFAIVPLFVVVALGLAAVEDGWRYLPVALATGLGSLGVALGVGTVVSVRLPQPAPESTTNLWAQRTGQGCGTGLVVLLTLFVQQLLGAPIAILVVIGLVGSHAFLAVAAVASLAYGVGVWFVGHLIARSWLSDHQAELLEILSARRT